MKDKTIFLMVSVLTASMVLNYSALHAQYRDDFLRPFWGYYDSQSLTTAVGNATVAAGQLIPGRTNNPANLGLRRFGEVQVNFQNNSFTGPNTDISNTRLGGVYGILPVPVYRGSLVFAGGVQRVLDFSGASITPGKELSEEGGLYATDLAVAVEASQEFFVGAAFNYLKGSDELSISEFSDSTSEFSDSTYGFLNPSYKGYYFSLGFVTRSSSNLQVGASVRFPTILNVSDKITEWPIGSPDSSESETWRYKISRPLTFHVGISLLYPSFGVMYELEWCDWSDMDFSSIEYYDGFAAEINREFKEQLNSTLIHRLGGVYHVPKFPMHLYGGYQYLPVPYEGEYKSDIRQSFSFGASYLMNQQFSVHGSWSRYFWNKNDRDEKYTMFVSGITMHF